MRRKVFVILVALISVTAHAGREDTRVQAMCGLILDGSVKVSGAQPVVTALLEFAKAVETPWSAARYARDLGSKATSARESMYQGFSSRQLTWSTEWNRDLVPLSGSVNVALNAFSNARHLAQDPPKFTRWTVIEGATNIKVRMVHRRLETLASPILSPLMATVRKMIGRRLDPAGPPILSRDASSAIESVVDRVTDQLKSDPATAKQVDFDDEMEFLNLVGAALSARPRGAMIYRERTFTLDLRVSDSLGGLLRLPTAENIERAMVKRKGAIPTHLDRKINVVELLKFNVAKNQWELHQAIRDVTLSELLD